MALSATAFTVASGSATRNRKLSASETRQVHGEVEVDDVLVAGQHQALFGQRRAAAPPPTSMRFRLVTDTFSTASIGDGRW